MKNKIGPVLIVLIIVVAVVGSTYSWFSWQTSEDEKIGVDFSTSGASSDCITYSTSTSGEEILIPVSAKEKGYITNIEIAQTCNTDLYADFDLNLTSFPTNLKDQSFKYTLVENNIVVGEGDFSNATQGDIIKLAQNQLISSTTRNYTLYLWIDGNLNNPNTMQNQEYNFNLVANVTDEFTTN